MASLTLSINRRCEGFTLAESLLASVVLALAVVGVCSALIASQQNSQAQERDAVAVSVARALMEEIIARPIVLPDSTPGWPTVIDRALYDSVSDFNGYTDRISAPLVRSGASDALASFNSASPTATVVASNTSPSTLAAGQYQRSVSVTFPAPVFGSADAAGDFALVIVTVHAAGGDAVKLSRLVARTNIAR